MCQCSDADVFAAHNLPAGDSYLQPFGAICPFLIALHFPRWPISYNICSLTSESEALVVLPSLSRSLPPPVFFSFWPFFSLIPAIHPPVPSLNVSYLPLLPPSSQTSPPAITDLTHPSPSLPLHTSLIVPDTPLHVLSHQRFLSLSSFPPFIHSPLSLLRAEPFILPSFLPSFLSTSSPSLTSHRSYLSIFPPSILPSYSASLFLSSSSPLLPGLHPSFAFKSYLFLHILPLPCSSPPPLSAHIRSYQSGFPLMSSMKIFSYF